MRPLTPSKKTALILYLAYAGLLIFVSIWSPTRPASSGQLNSDSHELRNSFNNLEALQSSFSVLWEEALARKGWDQESLLLQAETKLEEVSFGRKNVKWVNAKTKLLLPESVTQKDLAELITDWKKINRSLDLDQEDIKWGYQKGQLWLKLTNQVSVKAPGGAKKLPIYQLTLVTPSKAALNQKRSGLIPQRLPIIKPPTIIKPPVKIEPPKSLPVLKKYRVALIIDDVGSVQEAANEMLRVSARLTWAILPFTPYAEEYIKSAKEHGFEVILHLPLEPLDQKINPGPGVVKKDWTEAEIIDQFEADLSQVPGAAGVNNHMGSAGTADERLMGILMSQIKKKNIYFIDSMTTDRSVGETVARLNQVRTKRRNVFIDNLPDLDSKKKALRKLIKIAMAEGEAIGIGHVRAGTAEAIIEMLPEFEKAGIEIVSVSELLK